MLIKTTQTHLLKAKDRQYKPKHTMNITMIVGGLLLIYFLLKYNADKEANIHAPRGTDRVLFEEYSKNLELKKEEVFVEIKRAIEAENLGSIRITDPTDKYLLVATAADTWFAPVLDIRAGIENNHFFVRMYSRYYSERADLVGKEVMKIRGDSDTIRKKNEIVQAIIIATSKRYLSEIEEQGFRREV